MVEHVLANVRTLAPERTVLVIGPELESEAAGLEGVGDAVACAVQHEPLGTAHAVAQARPLLEDFGGDVIVVYADTPLVRAETLEGLVRARREGGAAAAVLSFRPEDPAEYGRLILAPDGTLARIVEYAEASGDERAVTLCNAGMMAIDGRRLFPLLDAIGNDNAKGEYYLTDLPAVVAAEGGVCSARRGAGGGGHGHQRPRPARRRRAHRPGPPPPGRHGRGGDADRPGHRVAQRRCAPGLRRDHRPQRRHRPRRRRSRTAPRSGRSATWRGFCVRKGAVIGPFARLRPGSDIGEGARVGNFVEVKGSTVAQGAKINHLSYVGDAGVGAHANIGAGTITCNYDGYRKSRTEIGDGAFIGSNTALVAPVTMSVPARWWAPAA